MKVAWIGLGQMGLPTAKAVAAGGHEVRAFDVKAPSAEDAQGLTLVGSPREAAQDADLVCLAVFSDDQVADVLTGPEGVIDLLKPGAIVAVFTTGSIESIQGIAASVPAGIAILDTCFSRKQSEMASGKLTLLVGGDADAIERGRPVFDTFAREIFHVGGSGAGRAIKLVNNILFAGHLQLASDAMNLAESLGLERASTATALIQCSGASDVLPWFAGDSWSAMLETARRYMVKDVAAAIDAGQSAGAEIPALAAATATYLAK
ncbi:NAD(P)-dependent oxidoreductase [Novosphingobium sp. MMS21-SN21R]|uniref:NAD(P)-dependent oxidoreductase n=1 Tax=Novosphingobium sp. MMS21-SN21R TaxID=2969298 RepID=UPI0028849243|nr:NAD(P)-dependent oxidoreductase [Novosphingobium sp. MMS21-SN21R]MDT0509630.1 NAD(P)-dependent oxidoreductase [Novosphingobium sp. MMS21-SN21R]